MCVPCAELLWALRFVHEMCVPCAELLWALRFVHELCVPCAELLWALRFAHEMCVPCAEYLNLFWGIVRLGVVPGFLIFGKSVVWRR